MDRRGGGGSWIAINNGVAALDQIDALAVDPQHPAAVLAGAFTASASGGFYRSASGSEDWPLLTFPLSPTALAIDPQVPNTIDAAGLLVGLHKRWRGASSASTVTDATGRYHLFKGFLSRRGPA